MRSSSKIITHIENGSLGIFVFSSIATINLTTSDLYNMSAVQLFAPTPNSITLIRLFTNEAFFKLNISFASNANFAIGVDAPTLFIANKTTIEAEQLFITNYPVDERHFQETNGVMFVPGSSERSMVNYGNILAKSHRNSGMAFDKMLNKGNISDNIDCKTHVGAKTSHSALTKLYDPSFHEEEGHMPAGDLPDFLIFAWE